MNRKELIEVGADALSDTWTDGGDGTNQELAAAVIDVVEPLIRADERERRIRPTVLLANERDRLRAQVLALPYVLTYGTAEIKRDDVLVLLDGGSDGNAR